MTRIDKAALAVAVVFVLSSAAVLAQGQATAVPESKTDTCIMCHSQLDGSLSEPVKAFQQDDIHQKSGLSCASCHGGDPSQEDMGRAMNPAKGFVAHPKRQEIPRFCGKCHSNIDYMKRFNPAERTDQESEYATSVHGMRLKQGDQKVAVCTSCHGFHGVKAVSDPTAPVYPLHVADTCGSCHANADYMRPYGIPTDQLAKWRESVHGQAMFQRQDLSAPTCNDCHGNHGAAPPSVSSVANVCGTCHVRQSQLFLKSPHGEPFEALGGCIQCHSNHDVVHPTDAMLGVGKQSVCVQCHSEGDPGFTAAAAMSGAIEGLAKQIGEANEILQEAASDGMEVSQPQFDLKDAQSKLVNARVVVHSFSAGELDTAVKGGTDVAQKALEAGRKALRDFQFRREGLAVSLIFLALAIAAIYLKLRQIERRQTGGH
jgi:predicted CXXCH cytochrome family protein